MLERVWRKENPFLHCEWECKLVQPWWKAVWVPQKIKTKLPYGPAIPLLCIYPDQNHNAKRYMQPYVHSSTIHNRQDMENLKVC